MGKDESRRSTASHPPARASNLAFGVERVGQIAQRFPILALILLVALAIAAGFGCERLKVDDSLSQLFRSDTTEFKQYEEVSRRFPSNEFDVLVVVDGKTLLDRSSLEKLRDFVTDIQLIDGTRGVISLFSAREPQKDGALPAPLFPEELPKGAEYDALIERVKSNEILRDKLLSRDGRLALIVLALDPAAVGTSRLADVIGEIRKTIDEDLAGSGLQAQLSGVPVMQLEIRNAVERDRLVYNTIGFVAGCLIAIVFFRRAEFMAIAAGPPLIAILLALGTLGWLEFRLNMFLNVMTPLIMVISFADSMQITFAARDRLLAGENRHDAFRNAVLTVGPACALTHATAGISFIALQFSSSDAIRSFGEAGLIATLIAFLAVVTLTPLLGVLLLRREARFVVKVHKADGAVDALRRFCAWVAGRMVSRPGLYSLISILVVAALVAVYANLAPRYRLADQVPDREQAVAASHRIDAKLSGTNPIDVLISLPPGQSLYAPETLAVVAEVHAAVEKQAGVGNVWSLETLRQWLAAELGRSDVATLRQYVDMLPDYLVRRFISAAQDGVIVSGRVPDVDASALLPIVDALDKSLSEVRARHPGYGIAVTGLAVIAARNSAAMIERLNGSLTIEIIFVAAFIGAAFRSVVVMLVSILPGLFPIVMSGTLLALTGQGLQFASIVALTVSFGLGLSATIHFLNRLNLEERPGEDPAIAVERATVLMGPALILTSVVLACGLAMTVLGSAVAAPVRLAQRLRDAGRGERRPADPAADRHVPAAAVCRTRAAPSPVPCAGRLRFVPAGDRRSRRHPPFVPTSSKQHGAQGRQPASHTLFNSKASRPALCCLVPGILTRGGNKPGKSSAAAPAWMAGTNPLPPTWAFAVLPCEATAEDCAPHVGA